MLIPLHLSRLADKSLLTVEYQGEEARYRFLETIREYAFEKLLESGEADRLRDRHLDFFLRLAEEAAPELAGPGQARWLERLEQEHDNLRAALRWSLDCQATDLGLRLSAGLTRFWRVRGHLSEARGWFEAVLQADEQAANARPAAFDPQRWNVRAKVLNSAGTMAWEQADYAQAEARYQESLNLRLQLEDQWGIAQSLGNLGYIALSRGDPATARAHGGMPGSVQGTGP
jgi:hypothetical protein